MYIILSFSIGFSLLPHDSEQAYGGSAIDTLEHLPIGLAAPLREAARTCQLSPAADWPGTVFKLIGRNDLAEGISAPEMLYSHGYKSMKENFVSTPIDNVVRH